VLLVEIQVTSPVGEVSMLRFSDRAIRPMPPTDGLRPNAGFDCRVIESPAFRRLLFDDLETLKPAVGVGALVLTNADRKLNTFEGHAWGEITVSLWTEGTPSSAALLVMKGLCAQPSYPRQAGQARRVRVLLADYSREGSKTLQTALYAGSNDGEAILYEGTAEGLKDTPKPLAFGDLTGAHIPAPLVNAAEQAHQLHDGAVEGSIALFDRGDAFGLVDDGDLVGAAFDGATPAAAHSVTDKGRGLVKFTAAPIGQFTAGLRGDAAGGYVQTAGPIMARLLARAGVTSGRIGPSVSALASAAVVGFYSGSPTTLAEALGFLAPGASAAILPGRDGVWQAVKFGPPAATPDLELGEYDIIDASSEDTASAPIGEVRIGYGRIWQTFTGSELAADLVGTDAQARLAAEYRWAVAADAGVKARFPDVWRTLSLQTALRMETDALELASSLKALFALKDDGRPRRAWRVVVPVETALSRQLGETVAITYPPADLVGSFLLIGEEPLRPRRSQAIWTVWG
jgi:hypothetical protein